MTDVQLWLIAAIVLFILEVITPGFVLANFGVAGLAAGIAAWLGASLTVQVIVFVVVCLASFVTLRPILRRTVLRGSKQTRTNVDALAGRMGRVTDAIPQAPEAGRVQVDGDNWRAMSVHGAPILAGSTVRIVRVDSTTLIVEQIS
ncbi:MAG: NfeD family protein [Bacteroidetes bacterium]|nr:NfeD family protein [Bacteroidota bacterium]